MTARTKTRDRVHLADLIDLELQIQRDKDADVEDLRTRDGLIGAVIGADRLEKPALYLAWLDELRRREDRAGQETTGETAARYLEVIGLVLFFCGAVLGGATVASWLAYHTDRPVNVIFFWSALVGLQLLLLLGWLIAVLPSRWLSALPGASGLQTLLRGIGRIPPLVMTWLSGRLSSEFRNTIDTLRGQARRLDWLYGKLRLWLLIRLTQTFAVAYNLGALVAFVAISYGSDPTFGWKSTLLEPEQLHAIVRVVAAPWSAWPEAVPTLLQVRQTQIFSLEDDLARDDMSVWVSWWPFLFASLLVYSMVPRLLTWLIAHWQVRRAIFGARLDHHELQKVGERLRRPLVETCAEENEPGPEREPLLGGDTRATHTQFDPAGPPTPVLKWAGVNIPRQDIEAALRMRFAAGVSEVYSVGELDEAGDRRALEALTHGPRPSQVVLLVEAWEPPVAEYTDMIARLRELLGEGALILVVLYHRTPEGQASPPNAGDMAIWQHELARRGDPWLAVEPLLEMATTTTSHPTEENDG